MDDTGPRLDNPGGVKTFPLKAPAVLAVGFVAVALAVLLVPLQTESLSVVATRALSRVGFAIPGMVYVSDAALAMLAAVTLAALAWSWKAKPQSRLVVVASAVGVVVAYGASEALKLLIRQDRPCGTWPSIGECDLTDYSFPSNHSTLAFGAVIAIALVIDKLSVIVGAAILAVAVALARILEGAHYLHDVAAGAALGVLVPGLIVTGAVLWGRRRSRLDPQRRDGGPIAREG